jgi:hypothetical protein
MATQEYPGRDLSLPRLAFALNEKHLLHRKLRLTFDARQGSVRNGRLIFSTASPSTMSLSSLTKIFQPVESPLSHSHLSLFPEGPVSHNFRVPSLAQNVPSTRCPVVSVNPRKGRGLHKNSPRTLKRVPLDIINSLSLLPPRTPHFRSIFSTLPIGGASNDFPKSIPDRSPSSEALTIKVVSNFNLDQTYINVIPSIPLFSNGVGVKNFHLAYNERIYMLDSLRLPKPHRVQIVLITGRDLPRFGITRLPGSFPSAANGFS